jgi:hypothetical protein
MTAYHKPNVGAEDIVNRLIHCPPGDPIRVRGPAACFGNFAAGCVCTYRPIKKARVLLGPLNPVYSNGRNAQLIGSYSYGRKVGMKGASSLALPILSRLEAILRTVLATMEIVGARDGRGYNFLDPCSPAVRGRGPEPNRN